MITALLVAIITAGGGVFAALINNGRHAKEIRRQITPSDDKTLAELIADHQQDLASIAIALGLHERDDMRHRPRPERNRRETS